MRLIDANKLIDKAYDVSPAYGMTVIGVTEEDIEDAPTVEAIPKDQYEARLKADMAAMLKEIQLQAEKNIENIYDPYEDDVLQMCQHNAFADCFEQYNDLIQEKINALKGGKEANERH